MVGYIGIIHIGPESHSGGKVLPHAFVFPHTLFTVLDKWLQAILLDLLLSIQPQKLFHLQLHGKTVGIPACFPWNHTSLHGPVSGDHILDNPCEHMADMGLAVGCGRAIIEHICGMAFSAFDALLKDVLVLPKLLHFFFSLHEIQIRRDFGIL